MTATGVSTDSSWAGYDEGARREDAGWWIFSHPGDVHCALYHLLVLAGYGLAFYLYLHPELTGIEEPAPRIAFDAACILLLGWITGTDIGVNYHNHVHRRIFKYAWMNRWFGRFWTFSGGWPAILWKHAHVTVHHANVLKENDWTVPHTRSDGTMEPYWGYCLTHWPYRYFYHFWLDLKSGRGGERFRREFPKELAIHLALWSIPFWIDPWMALWLWVAPQVFANITMGSGMYVQHIGCSRPSAEHPYRHSNDCLSWFFNLTNFNIGYHIEHHQFAHIHWCDLPALHQALKAHLDADGACETKYGYFGAADQIGRAGKDWSRQYKNLPAEAPAAEPQAAGVG